MQFQIVEVSEIAALGQLLVAREHDPKFRLDHAVMIFISNPHHKCRLSIQRRDHH